MVQIIDIRILLRCQRIGELLASGNGRIHCHPSDAPRFDFLPRNLIVTSSTMEAGKPFAIDDRDIAYPITSQPVIQFECP